MASRKFKLHKNIVKMNIKNNININVSKKQLTLY